MYKTEAVFTLHFIHDNYWNLKNAIKNISAMKLFWEKKRNNKKKVYIVNRKKHKTSNVYEQCGSN